MKINKKQKFIIAICTLSIIFSTLACSKKRQPFSSEYDIKRISKKEFTNAKIIKPASTLSKEVKALSGKWHGNWSGVTDSTLIIKEISTKKAKVYYHIEAYQPLKIKEAYLEIEADILNGKQTQIYWEVKDKKEIFKFTLSKNMKILRAGYTQERTISFMAMRKNKSSDNYLNEIDMSHVKIKNQKTGLDKDWYKKAVFMEIYIRGYKDSNGDGIGDIKGLINKLDYLKDLGIGGIWLMPIFTSTDKDHGYAVENYRDIEEDYGTLEDFETLIKEAHKRKIGIILDYVINHSSSSHALFEASKNKKSPYRDWYLWEETDPKGWHVGWRQITQNPWTTTNKNGAYYSVFYSGMPDFNLRNKNVVNFHYNNMKFWLNKGVDGFRFDAVDHLFENKPNGWEKQTENIPFLLKAKKLMDKYSNKFLVCESPNNSWNYARPGLYAFSFKLQSFILGSARSGKPTPRFIEYISKAPLEYMAPFLSNHDAFAGDRTFRLAGSNVDKNKTAAATYLLLPGIPFVYYGEEVGMGQAREIVPDQQLRSPMSWTANEDNAGFTTNDNSYRKPCMNVAEYNVENQINDENSLRNFYKQIINLRNNNNALSMGTFKHIKDVSNPSVFAFVRELKNDKFVVAINYYKKPINAVKINFSDKNKKYNSYFPKNGINLKSNINGEIILNMPKHSVFVWKIED